MNTLERLDAWLALPEEERMLLASVQTLASTQIAPRAEHADRSAEFPWDNVKDINALGLNAMFIPEAYGGVPMSYCAYLACVREISKACAFTGIIWATNFHGIKPVITCGIADATGAISALVVEQGAPGLSVLRTEDKLGLRASSTAALSFDSCRGPRGSG